MTDKIEIIIDPDSKKVYINVDDNLPFISWVMACEYLLHIVAQKSNAGYEKALELLQKGAMTYESKCLKGD